MKVIKKLIVPVLGAILVFFVGLYLENEVSNESTIFQTKVIELDNGFGYEIYGKKKLLIRQEYIPSIAGEVPFASYEEANEVANLVKDKISNGESPVVSTKELVHLNISF